MVTFDLGRTTALSLGPTWIQPWALFSKAWHRLRNNTSLSYPVAKPHGGFFNVFSLGVCVEISFMIFVWHLSNAFNFCFVCCLIVPRIILFYNSSSSPSPSSFLSNMIY